MIDNHTTDSNPNADPVSLDACYAMQDQDAIAQFLKTNPKAIDLLRSIPTAIKPYFPNDALTLAAFNDPDDQQAQTQLEVTIRTHQEPREALQNLDRFDMEWWLDALDAHGGNMFVTVAFA